VPQPSRHPALKALARFTLACAAAFVAAAPASATVLTANQLNVYRDGTSEDWLQGNFRFLADSFTEGGPYVGPVFTGSGLASSYTLQGLAPGADAALALREQDGQLLLNPNYGALSPNAQGGVGRSLRLRLLTNIDPSQPNAGLPSSRSFAAALRLSLTAMPDTGQAFGVRMSDGFSNNNDVIELFVAGGASGDTIVFRKQDFALGQISLLGTAPLAAPAGADALVLVLSHPTANTDQIYGVYGYADTSGALMGDLTTFANSATAFDGESFTRVELRATTTAPVPEPGTWAMFAGGLGLLLTRLRRRV
jgi:PEP-CTERM motif